MRTDNILDLIGNTPLIQLKGSALFAKAEFLNPGASLAGAVAAVRDVRPYTSGQPQRTRTG